MKKFLIFGMILVVVVFILLEMNKEQYQDKGKSSTLISQKVRQLTSVVFPKAGELSETKTEVALKHTPGSTPLEVADNYLNAHYEKWNIQNHHDLRSTVFKSPLSTRIKYAVYQGELPILGLEIQIEVGSDLAIKAVNNGYVPVKKADWESNQHLTKKKVIQSWSSSAFSPDIKSEKDISQVLVYIKGIKTPQLAYVIPAKDFRKRSTQILLRASDGQMLRTAFSRAEF